MAKVFARAEVPGAEIEVGAIYEGESTKRNEPINALLGPNITNSGGFRKCYPADVPKARHRSRSDLRDLAFVAIYSSQKDLDWPDHFDQETGIFTYFGDNKHPGHDLHHNAKGGNWLLHDTWDGLLSGQLNRAEIPPFFVFFHGGKRQDVEFIGLAVPGAHGLPLADGLVTLWRSRDGHPFQNYRATMTILDVAHISREWLIDLKQGQRTTNNAPHAWSTWAKTGRYMARKTLPVIQWRKPSDQKPQNAEQARIIDTIRQHYASNPYGFENFAAALVMRMEGERVTDVALTPPRRDGGRDALGTFRIGFGSDPVSAEFALEAKCTVGGLGVKQVARLLSRIRHRQFGVIVTTSYVSEQAYREIKEDQHPVAVVAARDIAEALIRLGYSKDADLKGLLVEVDGSPIRALRVSVIN
jgi:hypothetical protein